MYFAISSLSTGGLHGIPPDSGDWMFFFVGLYAATGVPIMGLTMGYFAGYVAEKSMHSDLTSALNEQITQQVQLAIVA